ncbi:MAG: type 1 glutamine amidotransferase domain-containing protein [Akkermansiaceae bacterium]
MKKHMLLVAALFSASRIFAADTPPAESDPTSPLPAKRILFVLTSHDQKGDTGKPTGFYLGEVTHPHHVLTAAGFAIDYVSPKGGKAPIDGNDLSDPINKAFMENPANVKAIETTPRPEQVKADDYAAIFYAGGHGTMWDFADNAELARIGGAIYDRGGVVGAVCHGPAGLVNLKLADGSYLVAGKNVAAFTNEEERAVELEKIVPFLLQDKLIERGAKHQAAPKFEAKVVVDGRLVTGQNPASATGVGEEMAKLLAVPAK